MKVTKPRADVKVGDLIWASMLIPKDAVEPGVLIGSKTSKRILKGEKVQKMALVVECKPHCLMVWYGTTFHGKSLEVVAAQPEKWEKGPGGKGWYYKAPIKVDADVVEVVEAPAPEEGKDCPTLEESSRVEESQDV